MRNRFTLANQLLQNAIDAFECGLEDYRVGSQARLKASLRNVFASVLLIFKEKLREMSPEGSNEALLKRTISLELIDGALVSIGKGHATVDFNQIKTRFKDNSITADWATFEQVRTLRNELEHYYTGQSQNVVQEAIVKCFRVAIEFINDELELDPKELFPEATWEALIEIEEIYAREREQCVKTFPLFQSASKSIEAWLQEHGCSECGSSLIVIGEPDEAHCRSCDVEWSYESLALDIAKSKSAKQSPFDAYEGHDPFVIDCVFCGDHSLVVTEKECFLCHETVCTECDQCGQDIPVSEWNEESTCAYCIHMNQKRV